MEYKDQVFKLEDTNCAYLGSELEKNVKLAAALQEDAWKGVGKTCGLAIWRIEKFKIVPWPLEEYGSFYSGDSYIILNTYQKQDSDKLFWNAHMWVGTFTTMDEAGTAAYKIVELDDVFNRQIVLFREAQGFESETFLSIFKVIKIMEGGIESGFKKVPVESYRPRLLHVRKCGQDFRVIEVPLTHNSLNSGDCFILDAGKTIFKWLGKDSNSFEKFKSALIVDSIKNERNGKSEIIDLEENDKDDDTFWNLLGGKRPIKCSSLISDKDLQVTNQSLFRLSDASGVLTLTKVEFSRNSLTSDDVFILDIGTELCIWIGLKTSSNEKKNSIAFAQQYLREFNRPVHLPFSCMCEGRETFTFTNALL